MSGTKLGADDSVAGDVTNKESIASVVSEISSQSPGGINVLFNNAGVAGEASREGWQSGTEDVNALSKQLLRSEFSEWARILETNVTAVYFTSAAFLPLLQKAQETTKGYASQIINVTSISGIMKGSSGGQFAYAASKEAAVQMSKVMATEFLPLKIRVNQIAVSLHSKSN
jgi:NAD(P)-dependent dehydrogenase (short-subunit alcohol dehydrogenase family)